mgnify:CR=1 FL=1
MPDLKTYDIFISHAWRYGNEYTRLVNLLLGAKNFYFRNYSAPKEKPLHNLDSTDVKTKTQIEKAIDRKISPVNCVLVISGMYAAYRKWMEYEISKAFEMGKPIIGVEPWGSKRIPEDVIQFADEMVGWNTDSIVDAIRRLSL